MVRSMQPLLYFFIQTKELRNLSHVTLSLVSGYAVTFACLDSKDGQDDRIENVEVKRFDGVHWEDFIVNEGKAIKGMSENQANS